VKNIWNSKEEDTEDECDEDEEAQDKVIEALRQQIKDIQASHTEFLHNLVLTLVIKQQEESAKPKLSPTVQAYLDKKKDNSVKQTGKAP